MARKMRFSWKKVISVVVAVVLLGGAIFGLTALFGKQTQTIGATAFKVGNLNETTGEYEADETAIYTRDAFSCQGLRIEPDFEAEGTFDVYYYDSNEKLLHADTGLTGVYESDYPQADCARVVYHPEVPEDVKASDFRIRFYEVAGYANELKITVDKKQTEYKTSTDLYVEGSKGTFDASDISAVVSSDSLTVSELITVSDAYDAYQIYVKADEFSSDDIIVAFGNAENKAIYVNERGKTVEGIAHTFQGDEMLAGSWYTVIIEVPAQATSLRVSGPTGAEFRIYGVVED